MSTKNAGTQLGVESGLIDAILEGDEEAAKQLRKIHRKLSITHHPDKGGNHEDFVNCQSAFDAIMERAGMGKPSSDADWAYGEDGSMGIGELLLYYTDAFHTYLDKMDLQLKSEDLKIPDPRVCWYLYLRYIIEPSLIHYKDVYLIFTDVARKSHTTAGDWRAPGDEANKSYALLTSVGSVVFMSLSLLSLVLRHIYATWEAVHGRPGRVYLAIIRRFSIGYGPITSKIWPYALTGRFPGIIIGWAWWNIPCTLTHTMTLG